MLDQMDPDFKPPPKNATFHRSGLNVSAPLWSVVLLTGLLPTWRGLGWLKRRQRNARVARGHCPACGYDLRGSPGRCPECGNDPAASTTAPAGLPTPATG